MVISNGEINIIGEMEGTGGVRLNNNRQKLRTRFDIVRKLGQGTYGKVQLAVNKDTGEEVAIKTIKKAKIESEQDLVRIQREIQIMSSVQHPHIIHIYEVFENKEKIVLVMEYANGGELYDYLSYKKVLGECEARRLFRQIVSAVYYCHKNKICHRDLKLENILLDQRGNAKIADFGLSNVFDEKRMLTTFCGSPLYASPEIVKGTPYYGPEVDCWSLGVLLYTLVYGAMPFDGSNFRRLVKQISEGDYYEPKKPSEASALIRRMLTVIPAKRATVEDICIDWWVNQGYQEALQDVSEEMCQAMPVRLDYLLSLATQKTPAENAENKPEETKASKPIDSETTQLTDNTVICQSVPTETENLNIQGELPVPPTLPGDIDLLSTEQSDTDKIPQLMEIQQPEDASQISTRKHKLSVSEKSLVTDSAERIGSIKKKKRKEELHEEKTKLKDNKSNVIEENKTINLPLDANKLPDDKIVPEEISSASQMNNDQAIVENKTIVPSEHDSSAAEPPIDKISSELCNKTTDSNAKDNQNVVDSLSNNKPIDVLQNNEKAVPTTTSAISDKKKLTDLPPSSSQVGRKSSFGLPDTSKKEGAGPNSRKTSLTNAANFKQITDSITSNRKGSVGPSDSSKLTGIMSMFGGRKGSIGSGDTGKLPPFAGPSSRKNSVTADSRLEKPGNNTVESNKDTVKTAQSDIKNNKSVHENSVDRKDENKTNNTILSESEKPLSFKRRDSVKDNADNAKGTNSNSSSIDVGNKSLSPKSSVLDKQRKGSITGEAKDTVSKNTVVAGRRQSLPVPKVDKMEVDESSSGTDTNKSEDEEKKMNLARKESLSHSEDSSSGSPHGLSPTSSKLEPRHMQEKKENKKKVAVSQAFSKVSEARKAFEAKPPEKRSLVIPGMKVSAARKAFETTQPDKSSKLPKPKTDLFNRRSSAADTGKLLDNEAMSPMKIAAKRLSVAELQQSPLPSKLLNGNEVSEIKEASTIPFNQSEKNDNLNREKIASIPENEIQLVNPGAENKENSSNETSFALSSEMITKSSDLEKAGKVLAIDSSQKMTGFVPTLDVTMEVKPVSKEPFSKLSSATKSIAKSAAEETSLNFTASVIPPETENDNDDLNHRISQSAIENSLHSTESSIASTSVTSKLTTNESKSSLEVTGDEYSPFSSASTLVPNFPSPSPSVTSLCSVPSPVPPVSEVKNMPSKDICGSETSFLARAFMHQHEKGSVSPPVGKNSPTPALREQPASPVTKDTPVLILIKDPPAPSQSEAESPKTKGTKISSVEIKLNTSESSTSNKASKNIEKPLQQIVPEPQPNIQHKSPGTFTLLGVKSEVSFNVEAAPPMDEPPSTVTTSYYSMPPLAPNAKSAKPPVIKSSDDKSAALPKSSKKNITTIPTTPPPTPPPATTSLPSTVLKLHDQTTEVSKVEEMAKPVQNKSPPSNHPESENTLVTAYSPVSSEIMTKKPRERLIPIQLEDSSNLTSVPKPIEEKNPTDKKSFRSSRLRSGSEGLYERGTSFSSDSGPGSPVDSTPNERGSQKSDDEQRGYGVYRSKFRSIHKAFLSDERRESSLEKSESFSSTGSTDDLEDIFDSFASENLLSNLLNRTRTIIDQLTNDDSTRRFGSVFSRMPLMGTSLSGFRSSFGRTDPFSRRDPFGRSEPSTSFRSDPFGKSDSFGKADSFRKSDSFGKADSFRKSDSFGSYCGCDSGLGSSRFSRSTSRQNSEPTNNSSFSSRNSWRSSRSQYPEKSEADNYMSDSGTGSTRKSRDSSTYSRTSSRDDESALSDNCSTRSSFSSARRSLFNYSRSVSTSISEEDVQSTTSTSNQTGSTRRFSERSSSREEGSTTSRFSRSRDSSITREGGSSRRESSLSQFARLSSRFHSDDFFGGSRDCLDSDFQDEFMSGMNDRRSYNRSLSSEYSRDNGIGSMRRRHSLRSLFDMANEKNSEKAEEVLVQKQEETRRRESQSRFLNRRSMRYDADDISIYGTIRRQPGHYLNYSKSLSKEISGRDSDEEILGIHRPRSILVLTDPDAEDASATDNEDSSSATDVSRGRYDSYDDSSRRGGGSAGGGGGGGNSGDGGGGENGERSSRSSYGGSRSFRQNSHGSSYGKGNKESDVSENRNVKASQFTENSSQLNNNNYSSELKPKAASDNEHVHDVLAGISIETSNDISHSDNSQISDDVGKKTSNQSCESKSINQTTSPSNNLKQEVPSKLNVKQENLNTKKNHLLYHQSGTKNSNTFSQIKKATNSPRNSLYDSYQMNKTPSDTNQIETDNPSPNSEQVVNSSVSMDKENSKSKHDQTIKAETCNSNGKPRKSSNNENQKSNNNLEANNETSKAKKYDEKWVGSVGKASGSSRFKNRRFGTNKELSKSEDALNKVGESDKDEILENKLSKDHDKANSSRIPRNILKFTRSISSELDRLQEDLNAVGSKVSQTKKYRNSVSVDESNTHKSRNFLNSQNVDEVVQELKKLEEDILNLSTNTYQKDSLLKTVDSKTEDVKQKEENNSLNITALKKNLLQKSSPSTPRNGNNSTDNLSILSDGYDSANPSDFEDSSSVCSDYGGALEEESVSERIRRKSYFARFQDNRHSRKSRKSLDLDGSKLYLNHKRHDDYLSSSGVTPRSNLSSTSFRHEDNTPTIRPRRSCSRTRENSLDDPLMTSSLGRRTSFGSRSHLNSSREILMNGDLHSEKPKTYTRSKSLVADSDVDSDCDRPASRASQMLEEALEGLDGMSVLSNVTSPTSYSKPYSRTHSLPDTETENQPYKSYLRQCSARSDSPTRSCYSSGTPNPTPHQSRLSYNDEMNSSPVLGWSGYEHRRLRPSSFAVTNNSSTPTPSTVRSRHDYLLNRHLGGYEEPVMERPFSPPSSRLPSVFDSQRSSDLRRYSAILDSSSPREVLRKALDICNSSQY